MQFDSHVNTTCMQGIELLAAWHSLGGCGLLQVLYATACCTDHPVGDGSFTPLQVNYAERFSAAGRTRCACWSYHDHLHFGVYSKFSGMLCDIFAQTPDLVVA